MLSLRMPKMRQPASSKSPHVRFVSVCFVSSLSGRPFVSAQFKLDLVGSIHCRNSWFMNGSGYRVPHIAGTELETTGLARVPMETAKENTRRMI